MANTRTQRAKDHGKYNQNGSSHVIIVVAIVVLLLAGLGYAFYNASRPVEAPENSAVPTDNKNPDAGNLKTGTTDTSMAHTLSFMYPESWTEKTEKTGPRPAVEGTESSATTTITSPDNKYSVVYKIMTGGTGVGGTCDESTLGKINDIRIEPTVGLPAAKFVQSLYGTNDGFKNMYAINLVASDSYTVSAKVGDTACNVTGLSSYIDLDKDSDINQSLHTVLSSARIDIQGIPNRVTADYKNPSETNEKDIEAALNTPEYLAAKAILISSKLDK